MYKYLQLVVYLPYTCYPPRDHGDVRLTTCSGYAGSIPLCFVTHDLDRRGAIARYHAASLGTDLERNDL